MRWFAPIQKACQRAIVALCAHPEPAPEISFSEALKQARKADEQRNASYQELADMKAIIRKMGDALEDSAQQTNEYRQDYVQRASELVEARQMAGSGPWLVAESRALVNDPRLTGAQILKESNPILSQGAYGDIELALQNINWRREINLSWLEFSRWGIQQIILISRLYYIKHPIIRRLIDIAAQYVFARGVEVSSPDPDANQVLQDFFERNKSTLGQIALTNHERAKYTDGNLFFCFFPDQENDGEVNIRTIDATEIQDIVCNPDDVDEPWYYRRCWTQRGFDPASGAVSTRSVDRWYPALGYEPDEQPDKIGVIEVDWLHPVYHRKCGAVAKWHFGCPLIYPALDWAREARRFLEACASVMQALSQIALKITTKGGQQALAGVKQQMQTTVGPTSALWDQNPPAVPGATFASGPGTSLEAFKTQGAGQDPERVRQYKLMCCMVVGVPESFLSDLSTGNLATATSLDRPTELVFLERQEAWREDLVTIAKYVLAVSARATNGKLREALERRKIAQPEGIVFREVARKLLDNGRWMYVEEASGAKRPRTIEVKCTFPSIREGDVPQLIKAISSAMTLDNKGGLVVGIDEKAGVKMLFETLGFENGAELTELMYPEDSYDPERSQEIEPAPIPTAPPISKGGTPQPTPGEVSNQRDEEEQEQEQPEPNDGKVGVQAHRRSKPGQKPSAKLKEAVNRLISAMEAREATEEAATQELFSDTVTKT